MTELDEVAEAIYEEHKWMYPVTQAVALSMSISQLDGQGYSVIHGVADKLVAFNSRDRTPIPLNWNASPNAEVLEVAQSRLTVEPTKEKGPAFWPMSQCDTSGRKYYIDRKRFFTRTWITGMLPVPTDGWWEQVESAVYDDFQRIVKRMNTAQLTKARK